MQIKRAEYKKHRDCDGMSEVFTLFLNQKTFCECLAIWKNGEHYWIVEENVLKECNPHIDEVIYLKENKFETSVFHRFDDFAEVQRYAAEFVARLTFQQV